MASSVFGLLSSLRPQDDQLPEEARSQIQVHRLLSMLGAGLVVGFAPLYAAATPAATPAAIPEAIDPLWARLIIAGLLLALLRAWYRSARVRVAYVTCVWSLLYIIVG